MNKRSESFGSIVVGVLGIATCCLLMFYGHVYWIRKHASGQWVPVLGLLAIFTFWVVYGIVGLRSSRKNPPGPGQKQD
jgi:hypothetical protein